MAGSRRITRLLDTTPKGKNLEIARRNATESPLLRLPGEVRNIIYCCVLGGETIYCDKTTETSTNMSAKLKLLEVCHQIYAEARLVPFAANTFTSFNTMTPYSVLRKIAKEQRGAIQTLRYFVAVDHDFRNCEGGDCRVSDPNIKDRSSIIDLSKFQFHGLVQVDLVCGSKYVWDKAVDPQGKTLVCKQAVESEVLFTDVVKSLIKEGVVVTFIATTDLHPYCREYDWGVNEVAEAEAIFVSEMRRDMDLDRDEWTFTI